MQQAGVLDGQGRSEYGFALSSVRTYAPKWDEKHFGDGRTYGQSVIEKAISGCSEVYGGSASEPASSISSLKARSLPAIVKRTSRIFFVTSMAILLSCFRWKAILKFARRQAVAFQELEGDAVSGTLWRASEERAH